MNSRPYAARKHVVRAWEPQRGLDALRPSASFLGLPTSKAIFLLYAFINRNVSAATRFAALMSALSKCR